MRHALTVITLLSLGMGCLDFSDNGAYRCDPDHPDSRDCADASLPDAGPASDSGVRLDAGAPDAGAPQDAGSIDAGTPDAGTPDAGSLDAGIADAGPNDAGTPDAGQQPRLRWGGLTAVTVTASNATVTVTPTLGERACAADGGVCVTGALSR